MNIVVLAGGTSTERDVSIVTGTMVCKALRRSGHNAVVIDVFLGYEETYKNTHDVFHNKEDLNVVAENLKKRTLEVAEIVKRRNVMGESFFGPKVLELCKAADIVFMGLHGSNGEDGKIQGTFDLMEIKYTGAGYLSSSLAMNKDLTKTVLAAVGVPVPGGFIVTRKDTDKKQDIPFPCVVKPCCGGSSVGVSIVKNLTEYKKALKEAFIWEDNIVVEEYVKGREFSIGVVEGIALPIIEIAPLKGFYDYKNKYNAGLVDETCPAELSDDITQKMQAYAVKSCAAINLETYGRVDFMLDEKGKIFCLEINTLPGMTSTSLLPQEAQATGMSYDHLCEHIIEISMKKYQ